MENLPREEKYQPPSFRNPMGTDEYGRDILSKLIASSKAYFLPSLLAVGIALTFGTLFGSVSGYYTPEGQPENAKEKIRFFSSSMFLYGLDLVLRYSFELINSLPRLAMIFLICATVSTNFYWIAVTLGVMGAMKLGDLLRNEIISIRQEEYIEAAIELGLKDRTIISRHLLRTRLFPILISRVFHLLADLILVETTLRFFFGIIPDTEYSWGKLLVSAKNKIFTLHPPIRGVSREAIHLWWFWFFPTLLIVANIIAFYLLADAFSVEREK